jgi:hypothetical protein
MTEREKLFLYSGILIGAASVGRRPSGKIVPWLSEFSDEHPDDDWRRSLEPEIATEFDGAAMRLAQRS